MVDAGVNVMSVEPTNTESLYRIGVMVTASDGEASSSYSNRNLLCSVRKLYLLTELYTYAGLLV